MADWDDVGCESSRAFDYNTLFDDITAGIMAKLDCSRKCDVVDELSEALDMSMLMDTRLKVFRFAKQKLLKTIEMPENLDMEPAFKDALPDGSLEDAKRMVAVWELIARKGKPRVALDAIDLLAYVSGDDPFFPHRLLKRRPTKCTAKATRSKNEATKQALLPYKPVAREPTGRTDGTSASSDSEGEDVVLEPIGSEPIRDGSQDMFSNDQVDSKGDTETQAVSEEEESSDDSDDSDDDDGGGADMEPAENEVSNQTSSGSVSTSNTRGGDQSQGTLQATDSGRASENAGEMYEIPADTPGDLIVELNTESQMSVQNSRVERVYAKLSITKPVTLEVAPQATTPPVRATPIVQPQGGKSSSTSSTGDKRQSSSSAKSVIMSTQTEWDLWGIPVASDLDSTLRPSSCRCDETERKFNVWRAEMERDAAIRDRQYRDKLNYLREEKLKADDDRERMKRTIAGLTKKVVENTGQMAEYLTREQRSGIPTKPKSQG